LTGIVIDSSILAKFILREEGWEGIRDVISRKPYTLELAMEEVANAIWRRITLLADISIEKAFTLLSDLLEMKKTLLIVEPQDHYLNQALKIAVENKISIYDALFIAQAITKQATLVSSDREQCRVAEKLNIEVIYV
jgi:predicted nucleic acid-binding protein